MIRKLVRINAPLATVSAMFQDLESWPQWMAGVRKVRILESSGDVHIVEVTHLIMGQSVRQLLECRLGEHSMTQRQLKGSFKRWNAVWRFFEPPEGHGTTASMEFDLDLGLFGLLVPNRLVQRTLDRMFVTTARNARERGERLARTAAPATTLAAADGEVLLRLVQRGGHLELHFRGRRYRLEAMD